MENSKYNLTSGPVFLRLIRFTLPYLAVVFMQQLYGLADLFIVGQYEGPAVSAAVSNGSQFMHMLTAVIIGLTMGTTVLVSRNVGANRPEKAAKAAGNTVTLFLSGSIVLAVLLIAALPGILHLLQIPSESLEQCRDYLMICLAGIPVITAYNLITCIFRGCGDSASPSIFVFCACIVNIALDYLLIGGFHMASAGAAWATLIAQLISVLIALAWLQKKPLPIRICREDLRPDRNVMKRLLAIGVPIACQDGFIQISFLIITAIGNMRGITDAAAIGIVEKLISFLFMVPSAMSQSLSALASQNVGAGLAQRAYQALKISVGICLVYGFLVVLLAWTSGEGIISLFIHSKEVAERGAEYFRSYSFDAVGVAVHFCMASYFCAYEKSMVSFVQNLLSVVLFRIPLSWLGSVMHPETLFYMGLAAPAGSFFQAAFCLIYFQLHRKFFLDLSQKESLSGKQEPQSV